MQFIEITSENWEEVIQLKPKDEQAPYLRTDIALHSLAKCYVRRDRPDRFIPYAIEQDGQLIGSFLLRSYGRGCNLTGFFIDEKFQGQELGRQALEYYLEFVQENYPDAREIELTIAPGNTIAERLYQSFGFEYTGEVSDRGNLYMELQLSELA